MIRVKWVHGRDRGHEGPVFVSTTKTKFRNHWILFFVMWHGRNLLRSWRFIDGAVGVSTRVDILKGVTYSISTWKSEKDYYEWVRSPYHLSLMKTYKNKTKAFGAEKWQVEKFDLDKAWARVDHSFKTAQEVAADPTAHRRQEFS